MNDMPKNPFFLVSGPSGVGKNTIVEGVLKAVPELQKATTYTSRAPRPGELEKRMKYFVSREEFERKIADDELFEWAEYAGNYYGTPKKELLELLKTGPAITDIEVQGAAQLRKKFPLEKLVTIFLKPPTTDSLVQRIQARAPISAEELQKRIDTIEQEMAQMDTYDHVIVNEEGKPEQTIRIVAEHVRKALRGPANPS